MYRSMLFIHWKQIRVALIPFVIASFGLPVLTVHWLGSVPDAPQRGMMAYRVMTQSAQWLPLYPLLAGATGITLALSAWNWDHQLGHVYALSLPLARWKYAGLKMGAGAVLALIPAAAFWIGALIASASVTLPAGLHAYPTLLAVRFLAATLVAYAVLFAMAAGTIRTTVWFVSAVVGLLILTALSRGLLASHFTVFQRMSPIEWVLHALASLPGPFHVFSGNWMLIDV